MCPSYIKEVKTEIKQSSKTNVSEYSIAHARRKEWDGIIQS